MSKRWFVSRHEGAIAWMERQGYGIDQQVAHLHPEQVQAGDIVYGTLPIHLAAEVCARGAHYYHLALELTSHARGRELSADELDSFSARLIPYHCSVVGG